MTNFRKFTATMAILGATACMSSVAVAKDSYQSGYEDMTCDEFNALSPDDQMATIHEMNMNGGKDRQQAEARGADAAQQAAATGDDAAHEVLDGVTAQAEVGEGSELVGVEAEGGKDAAQAKMRGDDELLVVITGYCRGAGHLSVAGGQPNAGSK